MVGAPTRGNGGELAKIYWREGKKGQGGVREGEKFIGFRASVGKIGGKNKAYSKGAWS